jgi:hypothetical protein
MRELMEVHQKFDKLTGYYEIKHGTAVFIDGLIVLYGHKFNSNK